MHLLHSFTFYFFSQELQYQNSLKKKDKLPNDRYVESVGSFVKVANFSIQEVEETYKEMEDRVCVMK